MDVTVGLLRKLRSEELMLLNYGVGEDSLFFFIWRRLLRVPWTARRFNQSILKVTSPGCSLKDWCWSWNSDTLATWCEELSQFKRPWCWERLRAGEKGSTEDEMVGWHHWLDGHGVGWTLGVGDGQGCLACWGSWGHKESDMTEWLNWYIHSEYIC